MSASQIVATLQGHHLVLTSELNTINADIVVLQQMNHRYAVQCGILSFSAALDNLLRLRGDKERLLAQVVSQLRGMEDHVASSSALVSQLHFGAVPHVSSIVAPSTSFVYPSGQSYNAAIVSGDAPLIIGAPAASGMVQVHTPSGLVVTTNSTILANSPARVR